MLVPFVTNSLLSSLYLGNDVQFTLFSITFTEHASLTRLPGDSSDRRKTSTFNLGRVIEHGLNVSYSISDTEHADEVFDGLTGDSFVWATNVLGSTTAVHIFLAISAYPSLPPQTPRPSLNSWIVTAL